MVLHMLLNFSYSDVFLIGFILLSLQGLAAGICAYFIFIGVTGSGGHLRTIAAEFWTAATLFSASVASVSVDMHKGENVFTDPLLALAALFTAVAYIAWFVRRWWIRIPGSPNRPIIQFSLADCVGALLSVVVAPMYLSLIFDSVTESYNSLSIAAAAIVFPLCFHRVSERLGAFGITDGWYRTFSIALYPYLYGSLVSIGYYLYGSNDVSRGGFFLNVFILIAAVSCIYGSLYSSVGKSDSLSIEAP
jgi:hypothetical protein